MLLCETCYHGGPLEKIFIAVISQSLSYNSYIIVVRTVWYSCVFCNFVLCSESLAALASGFQYNFMITLKNNNK